MSLLRRREKSTEDWVIEAMTDDYVTGRWTLEQFETMVANRLRGLTPVDGNGWPLYYEPGLLDGCEQFAP